MYTIRILEKWEFDMIDDPVDLVIRKWNDGSASTVADRYSKQLTGCGGNNPIIDLIQLSYGNYEKSIPQKPDEIDTLARLLSVDYEKAKYILKAIKQSLANDIKQGGIPINK